MAWSHLLHKKCFVSGGLQIKFSVSIWIWLNGMTFYGLGLTWTWAWQYDRHPTGKTMSIHTLDVLPEEIRVIKIFYWMFTLICWILMSSEFFNRIYLNFQYCLSVKLDEAWNWTVKIKLDWLPTRFNRYYYKSTQNIIFLFLEHC